MSAPRSIALALVLSFTTLIGAARAQTTYHVSRVKFEAPPWVFTPILSQAPGGQVQVHSLLAVADIAQLSGGNLVAVWYVKRPNGPGYDAQSWHETEPERIIKSVVGELELSEEDTAALGFPSATAVAAPAPRAYTAGVLADDPIAAVIQNSPDRELILNVLVQIGYPAANLWIEQSATDPATQISCGPEAKLDAMASIALSGSPFNNQATSEEVQSQIVTQLMLLPFCLLPPIVDGPNGPWSPPGPPLPGLPRCIETIPVPPFFSTSHCLYYGYSRLLTQFRTVPETTNCSGTPITRPCVQVRFATHTVYTKCGGETPGTPGGDGPCPSIIPPGPFNPILCTILLQLQSPWGPWSGPCYACQ